MINPADYTIVVKRVPADGEHVFRATVKELPHLAEYANSFTEAYELAVDAIETLFAAANEEGRDFPAPIADGEADFSGRVTLRMPRSLHRQMSEQADSEGISFNQYLVSVLAYAAARGAEYFSEAPPVGDKPAVLGLIVRSRARTVQRPETFEQAWTEPVVTIGEFSGSEGTYSSRHGKRLQKRVTTKLVTPLSHSLEENAGSDDETDVPVGHH